ncbi:ATP-binding cassette domain-containing protein [Stenotrophomonas sp. ZAC14A_NAIMI4_1]|uniref:ABC transporter ATP-binding protein n=1 Tax=Stenotrophomonas sp. ZAC14A_NAIMI4_1 TaxID=2072412 RepID=UPI000D5408DA|nr:ATP-binding cassette domain-containing protein [Stenotrophomonas sp. ZAC14A_NAIMI4_1]AWH44373.1 ABC transporter ATP-binding protein [Stenotrophomonas sp. ZAC14A_NAIMI4_1]
MLHAEHLCKNYGSRVVLHGLEMQVDAGEIVGIIGANGVGKTTLFRVLCNLIPADSGVVSVAGSENGARAPWCDIGYLPESRSLFPEVTVGRSLEFWSAMRGMTRSDAVRARDLWLGKIGLLDRASHRVSSLSKGNLQKLQIAACMLHSPKVLVLDEPFSGLDPANQVAVVELISAAARQGAAVVLSAHHIELLQRFCGRILVLKNAQLQPAKAEDLHLPAGSHHRDDTGDPPSQASTSWEDRACA